ncbi:ferredoxin family protein [Chloroflexota bacterium]
MGIEKIDGEVCNGCQLCVRDCPMDVIRFDEAKRKAYIAYGKDCGVCFQCTDVCSVGAITVSAKAPRRLILPY